LAAEASAHRCGWVSDDPLYQRYHDTEWGVPSHDERHLFEMMILEGAQAGLSWITILKKRENYRAAFDNFDAAQVARFTPARLERLLLDPGIVRNRAKVNAAVLNARAVLKIRAEHGSLDAFLWNIAGGKPVRNRWASYRDAPTRTAVSDAMSKALLGYGCKFVGSTICYSLMQAAGMVNDHETGCFRHRQVAPLEA
jgi:DNA-3-methyladenine glycosylase I